MLLEKAMRYLLLSKIGYFGFFLNYTIISNESFK